MSTKDKVSLKFKDEIFDVPKFSDLPVRTVMKVLSEPTSEKQFMATFDLLIQNVSKKNAKKIEAMSMGEASTLVNLWVSASSGEEAELW